MAWFNNEGSSSTNHIKEQHLFTDVFDTSNSVNGQDDETEYPLNTKPLENQVAGHTFRDGKRTIGMLKHKDGYVLKPVNRPCQGEKEIKFYEDMQTVIDPIALEFKHFIPNYYGTSVLEIQGKQVTFLLLEDVTNGFEEPCVMDIKIGSQSWEPGASIEKQQSELKKYTECRKTLHFCIPGFQTYDIKTKVFKRCGKNYGKQLNADGVYEAFKIFLNVEHKVSEQIIVPMLKQLKDILNWWKKQNVFHIYSSSILLTYDASVLRSVFYENRSENDSVSNCNNSLLNDNSESSTKPLKPDLKSWLRVYLIDFAHVVSTTNGTSDLNYITGITSLIKVFENLLVQVRLENKLCNTGVDKS